MEVSREAETQASVVGILLLVLQGHRHQHFLSTTLNHKWGLPKSGDKAKTKRQKRTTSLISNMVAYAPNPGTWKAGEFL